MWKKRLCLALIMICAGTAFASIRKVQGQFQFDGANRLTNTITPLNHSTSLVFNQQGLIESLKDADTNTTTYGYDAKGRMTSRADSVGTTTYNYDANNNTTNIFENGLTNSWAYDAYNRVSSYKDVYGDLIQYKYDANGNLTNLIYPGNRTVTYAYDNLNRMTNVTDWAGRKTSLNYDLDGRVTSLTRPNGTYRTISYDAAGEATNILEQTSLGFPIALFRHNWNANATMQWEFAAPLPHTNAPPTRTMTYDDDNRLATVDGNSVANDSDGNLVSGPLTNDTFAAYIFDARNRLLNASGVTNAYDAMNNRVGQTYGTNTVIFVVNPNAKLPQILMRIKNGVTNYYVYGVGLLYQVTETATATNTLTYHYDTRGSTIALTDDNGNVTDRMEYSAYATLTYHVGTTDTPFLFNGMYGVQSDPNGLLYMKARYYNPFLCRFINPDPTGFSGGMNFYAYANGNPISLIDPFGLGFWSVTGHYLEGAGIAVGVGVVVVLAAPEIVAGGATALVWAGLSDAAATTASTAIVTGGLGLAGGVGVVTTGADVIHNANAGNWDNVAFDAGTLSGGFLLGGLGGGRYLADNVSPTPSTVPPSWNPFTADYVSTPTAPNGYGFTRNPNLPLTTDLYNWLGTGPTPTSGGTSAAFGVSGLSAGFDLYTGQNPVDWLGNSISSSTTGKPH